MSINCNISNIKQKIADHAAISKRDPSGITLVGVTKNVYPGQIKEAIKCGLRDFGENYAQEFRDKYRELREFNHDINWHFIGTLQKNKVKYIVGKVKFIHSIDDVSIAEEINKRYGKSNLVASVLLEVSNGQEDTKSGIPADDVARVLTEVNKLENIETRGLMCMAPYYDDPENARPLFRELRGIKEDLSQKFSGLDHLSMGMSNDFHIAIEEGSTIIRIGTAIFGQRNYE